MRYGAGLEVGVKEVEGKCDEGNVEGKVFRLHFFRLGEVEAEGVDDGAVCVVEEIEGEDNEGNRVGPIMATGVEDEREPEGRALHKEPGECCRQRRPPSRLGMPPIGRD